MKAWLVLLLCAAQTALFGQQSAGYFPAANGYTWIFKNTPLDSVQNPIDSLTYYQLDSLAGEGVYLGVTAKYVLGKSGSAALVSKLPYLDTTYLNFAGTEAKEYFRIPNLDSIASTMTRTGLDTILGGFNLINTFKSFEKWYSMYKFASTVNASYTIFQYDTTITVDSLTLPLRFLLKGKKLADKQLQTELGTFTTKVFLFEFSMNYLVTLPPPLPAAAIPLLTIPDSMYIAENKWILRRVIPSTSMSLSTFGFGTYTFPGMRSEIVTALPWVGNDKSVVSEIPESMILQNYPNPFNPATVIRYSVNTPGTMHLTIYNQLGELIHAVNREHAVKGVYEYRWAPDATTAAGVYILQAASEKQSISRKLIYLK